MKVSRRSTQRAAAIKNDPDLAPAVERGHVTVADAYQVRDEPTEVKRRAVEIVEAGEAPTLAGAVKRLKQEEVREQAIAEATNIPRHPICSLHRSASSKPGSGRAASTSSPRCRRRRAPASRVACTATSAGSPRTR